MPPQRDRSEFPPRPQGVAVNKAAESGWGGGWPNCQRDELATIRRDDGLRIPVRREIAELVALLMAEAERRGYDIRPEATWGFACRPIRGSTTRPSNHSWGLAVDINADENPRRDTLVSDMPSWMPALWWDFGFFWGGWYNKLPDAMHYEFVGTPEDAARLTERARTELGALVDAQVGTTPPGGSQSASRFEDYRHGVEAGTRTVRRGNAGDDVKVLQQVVGTDPDGLFGAETEEAVRAFQAAQGLEIDGIVGPQTWKAVLELAG